MKFLYGYDNTFKDITDLVFTKCFKDNIIVIPSGDNQRADIFSDPLPGILKHIVMIDYNGKKHIYTYNNEIKINLNCVIDQIYDSKGPKKWWNETGKNLTNIHEKLAGIHSRTTFLYGNIMDEYNEQTMSSLYLNENSKVLELGGNLGRNTIVISTILKDERNCVTLESDPIIAAQLVENIGLNGLNTHIEASALSMSRLIQNQWDTLPLIDGETIPDGWKEISTITYQQLKDKYNIQFDTLVADCEGALYYILKDDPSLLEDMNLLLLENDYKDIDHKEFVDKLFTMYGFTRIYIIPGGWGPCYNYFWEVWKKQ